MLLIPLLLMIISRTGLGVILQSFSFITFAHLTRLHYILEKQCLVKWWRDGLWSECRTKSKIVDEWAIDLVLTCRDQAIKSPLPQAQHLNEPTGLRKNYE